MTNIEAFPIRLERAELTVCVDLGPAQADSQTFVVLYTRKGKPQKESFTNLEVARKRAQVVLAELVDETFPIEANSGGIMVRIYLTPTSNGYDSFTVSYYQEGKRKREAFGSLAEARKRAKNIHDSLVSGAVQGASMTNHDREAFLHAMKHLEPIGITLESACKEYAAAYALLGGVSVLEAAKYYAARHTHKVASHTVKQVVDEFLATKEDGRATKIKAASKSVSDRYLYDLRNKLEKFAARFNCQISLVTADEINKFVHGLKKTVRASKKKDAPPPKPVSGRTKNNYLQAINVLLEFAKKQKYLPRDLAIMDEVEQAEEDDFEIEIFTPEEITKILAAANKDIVPVIAIGAFAGVRTAEISRLDWSEVNLEKRYIEVKKSKAKTRSRRLVPIPENLVAWLKPIVKTSGPIWERSEVLMFEQIRDSANDASVKWKHNALRHSFISYRVAINNNVNEVAMEAGNSPDMIFKHYRELVTEETAKTWFGITPETVASAKEKLENEKAAKVVALPKTVAA